MPKKYLIDVNLPKYFSFFSNENFEFVQDINTQMTDSDIWNYALKHDLIILTKDTDFIDKVMISAVKPKNYLLSNRKSVVEKFISLF